MQVVAPPSEWQLHVEDLRGVVKEASEAEASRVAREEARCPFDLSAGPLLRARLLRLDDADHMFLLTMHHIVSDGWSIGVFVREFTALYEAFSNGEASPLPELPIQYADYSQCNGSGWRVSCSTRNSVIGNANSAAAARHRTAERPSTSAEDDISRRDGGVAFPPELSEEFKAAATPRRDAFHGAGVSLPDPASPLHRAE